MLGEAFGEGWAFLPLGALLVDFTLTVAVSSAAGFGLLTLWIMVAVVGGLTIWISVLAVRLGIGVPKEGSTLLAEVAIRATGGDGFFAAFQAASALLLIAASASAYVAVSGLLRALALYGGEGAA